MHGEAKTLSFEDMTSVLAVVADTFFQIEDQQCKVLKSTLICMEDRNGTGRVRIDDFYKPALVGGEFQFTETIGYLRDAGALDESDSGVQRVIIPNYIQSFSNCLNTSAYYAVCCMDECERLMVHMETQVQAPMARPSQILSILASSSADMLPLRDMIPHQSHTSQLQSLLEDVAEVNGGHVPLHGRLFAQWMHYAYPRECPFPHLSGTTSPRETTSADVISVEHEDIKNLLSRTEPKDALNTSVSDGGLCSAMWSLEEELLDRNALNEPHLGPNGFWQKIKAFGVMASALGMVAVTKVKMASSCESTAWAGKRV